MTTKKPTTYPKSLAACVDLFKAKREARLAADKVAADLKKEEDQIELHILSCMDPESTGIAGKVAQVSKVIKETAIIEDWDVFIAYVRKSGKTELLQHRCSDAAVKELWDDGKTVPGIGLLAKPKLSLRKV